MRLLLRSGLTATGGPHDEATQQATGKPTCSPVQVLTNPYPGASDTCMALSGLIGLIGLIGFIVGTAGIMLGSKGQRGWDTWSRQQRVVCSIGFLLVIAGLAIVRPA
jgi:hypothetical protein